MNLIANLPFLYHKAENRGDLDLIVDDQVRRARAERGYLKRRCLPPAFRLQLQRTRRKMITFSTPPRPANR